jgi:hypothetical protein
MTRKEAQTSLGFDPDLVMGEWRRFYDWAVLSRRKVEYIDMISCLGQKFSGILSAYRLAKRPQRRERLYHELRSAFEAMQTFYDSLPPGNRIVLTLQAHDSE